ncbi:hypothetical protein [Chitinophaga tropicalis]|uniref:YD repeat-containing protein n=1 Tax=Chitinophaga tropicalis TaxID=2683588 RepID=A0A7K1UDZ1_9BACT|nr:hypothetical protein [Chitinophaga tropicalis]MVT12604.1 hypothetical protein [Chitinophaga tropicalis]
MNNTLRTILNLLKQFVLLLIFLISSPELSRAGERAQAPSSCACECLKPLFDYLISSHRLFINASSGIKVSSLLRDARRAGYDISYTQCAILYKNINKPFYAITTEQTAAVYKASIGDCEVALTSSSGASVSFYNLQSDACSGSDAVSYHLQGSSTKAAELTIGNCYTCTTATSGSCYSAVTDTSVNAFVYGLQGNWRPLKAYAYYGERAETDPAVAVKYRTGGIIPSFTPFWTLSGNKWKAQPDTTKWLWMSETTLYNVKGIEIENKDPYGRYTAGLYGYDNALPVAVAQNARYRETAYDGFEDYFFTGIKCDNACDVARSFDFSQYKTSLDTTEQHTGKYSLRVDAGRSYGITTNTVAADTAGFMLSYNAGPGNCAGTDSVLYSVKAGKNSLIPSFSPIAGTKLLFSAWVKEGQPCRGLTYTGNQVQIRVRTATDSTTIIALPAGNITEGWQRYEQVIDLPAGTRSFSVYMLSTGSVASYFDDMRIHPYNANMKSFVYSPENLRLMAELDENNYATFYEYDDDGTLIRLKKETERGIQTIKETRSALQKEVLQ